MQHQNRIASGSQKFYVRSHFQRRGIAVIYVLALIAIAMSVSYAMLRTQSVNMRIVSNATYKADARRVAQAATAIAMRKMTESNWGGVGSQLAGNFAANESYFVFYSPGDATLYPSHPDYKELPFRVTIAVMATVTDPGDSTRKATHTMLTVVQLVRRKLANSSLDLSQYDPYTVYQWGNKTVPIEAPVRIEGEVYLNGQLRLADDYPHDAKPFHGTIDEVAIFDKKLSDVQVQLLYILSVSTGVVNAYSINNPVAWWRLEEAAGQTTATDSAGSNDGIYSGPTLGASGAPIIAGTHGAHFDGVDDYIDVGKLDIDGKDMTIIAWFKADSFGEGDARIISKATGTAEQDHYWMLSTIYSSGSYRLRFRIRKNGNTTTWIAPSGNLTAGQWYCAAVVVDDDDIKLYLNGSVVGDFTGQGSSGNIDTDPDVRVFIGDNPPGSSRGRYFRDLEAMRVAGLGDYRPFTGPVHLPRNDTPSDTLQHLEDNLQVATHDITPSYSAPTSFPSTFYTYQLYAGGPIYNVETLPSNLSNITKEPNPHSNPLGIFRALYSTTMNSNVTIRGTLIIDGWTSLADAYIYGPNVNIEGIDLPAIEGSQTPTQLPTIIALDDVWIKNGATGSINGLVMAWDDFEVLYGAAATDFDVQGRIMCSEFEVYGRSEWDQSLGWWGDELAAFLDQLEDSGNLSPVQYFPQFMEQEQGLAAAPLLSIGPNSTSVSYHWHDWSNPIYVPHPNDGGLRWEVVKSKESL